MSPIIASFIASTAGLMSFILAQETQTNDVQGIITQLGIFGVVIAVFKFMLSREDVKDAKADEKEEENVIALRKDIEFLRLELAQERDSHEHTRKYLYDLIKSKSEE